MNLLPFDMAILAPNTPPNALHIAMGIATCHKIWPFKKNNKIDPRFVARFISLAWADACKKSKPNKLIKARTKKLPAPGPINPS